MDFPVITVQLPAVSAELCFVSPWYYIIKYLSYYHVVNELHAENCENMLNEHMCKNAGLSYHTRLFGHF